MFSRQVHFGSLQSDSTNHRTFSFYQPVENTVWDYKRTWLVFIPLSLVDRVFVLLLFFGFFQLKSLYTNSCNIDVCGLKNESQTGSFCKFGLFCWWYDWIWSVFFSFPLIKQHVKEFLWRQLLFCSIQASDLLFGFLVFCPNLLSASCKP